MDVLSLTPKPSLPSKRCPGPADVLFKRGVRSAGVAARDHEAIASTAPARCGGEAKSDQRAPVQSVLRVLRQSSGCVPRVASQLPVASAYLSRAYPYPVASVSRSNAYPSARSETPASTLPLVLRALTRRAAAAKVSRGRRRLEVVAARTLPLAVERFGRVALRQAPSSAPITSGLRGVASELVSVASVASRSVRVASSELFSSASQCQSVASLSPASLSVAFELSQSRQRPGRARVVH